MPFQFPIGVIQMKTDHLALRFYLVCKIKPWIGRTCLQNVSACVNVVSQWRTDTLSSLFILDVTT